MRSTVIKVLKRERDKLRKQIAQGGFRQPSTTKARALLGSDAASSSASINARGDDRNDDTSGGTINALIANAGWAEKKSRSTGTGHASAQVADTRSRRTRRCSRRTSSSRQGQRKRRRALALIPLHERRTRLLALVVPLKAERLLAQDRRLEASPRLDLEVVERAAVRAQAMRDAGRKIHERAGLDLLRAVRRPRPCRGL